MMSASNLVVVDAHNDLLLELAARADLEDPFGDLWLDQLRAGGVRLQICPIWADPTRGPQEALVAAMRQAAAFHGAARARPEEVAVVRTREDLEALESDGRIGLLLALEGAECLTDDLRLLDVLWELGVRMVGPFWAGSNAFGDGSGGDEHGGLTVLGRELVARLADRGFIVDLAHATDASFADILEAAVDALVMISHVGCRALYDYPAFSRNASDEQLVQIAERGGVIGVFALPVFLDPVHGSLAALVDHVEHAVNVAGMGRVGLGGDFAQQLVDAGLFDVPAIDDGSTAPAGGAPPLMAVEGVAGPAGYPTLLRALRDRGVDADTVASVAGGAMWDFFSRSLPRVEG